MVKERNKRRLDDLKDKMDASSYNEVISYLFERSMKSTYSMFGTRKDKKQFIRKDKW